MLTIPRGIRVYCYRDPIDLRKGVNGLAILLADALGESPQSGDIYLFRNRQGNKVKLIHWHKTGFMLHYKCLERGRFKFPRRLMADRIELNEEQLGWLLAGLDFMLMSQCPEMSFSHYY